MNATHLPTRNFIEDAKQNSSKSIDEIMMRLIFFLHALLSQPQTVSSFSQLMRSSGQVALHQQHLFPTIARTDSSFQTFAEKEEFSSESKRQYCQRGISKFYHGASLLYCGTALLSLKKYGLTLKSLNFAGEPFMAAGITYLLRESSGKGFLGFDTFKRLNGLMFLYAQIRLVILTLMPNMVELDSVLGILSILSTTVVSTKGYFLGLRASGDKLFLPETFRLCKAAGSLTMSLPTKNMTYPNFIRLLTVAIRKGAFLAGILNLLWFGKATRLQIVPKLSQLGKLTLLGGSLITSVSVEPSEKAQKMTVGPINFMAFYVFSLMSGTSWVGLLYSLE